MWTRLEGFDPGELTAALHRRELVKATLQRSTLHVVGAADYQASLPALMAVTRARWMHEQRGLPVVRTLPELTEASLDFAAQPRANVELRDHAGRLGEPVSPDELWRRIRRYGAFVHVPGADPWAFGRRPVQIAARAWLEPTIVDEEASLEHVVRTYLRAFGPARLADIARWSGLTTRRLRIGLERIDDVIGYEDERGRALFDVPGALLPRRGHPRSAPPAADVGRDVAGLR